MLRKVAFASALAIAAIASPVSAATLTTHFNGGNGQDGIMFDIVTGANALTLQSLTTNADNEGSEYAVYYRAGGIAGQENNAAAWTLLTSFTGVVSAGPGNPTTFDIDDLALAANSTYALYVTGTDGAGVEYTDGSVFGGVIATDGNLSILSGYGKGYPFDSTFSPRDFNGSLTYALSTGAVPEPATWAMMIGGFGLIGGAMRRRRQAAAFA